MQGNNVGIACVGQQQINAIRTALIRCRELDQSILDEFAEVLIANERVLGNTQDASLISGEFEHAVRSKSFCVCSLAAAGLLESCLPASPSQASAVVRCRLNCELFFLVVL